MKTRKHIVLLLALSFLFSPSLWAQDTTTISIATQDTSGASPDFVNVDTPPQIVSQAIPEYPEEAKEEQIGGRVIVKLWVDANGDVKKAVVLKSSNEIFNRPSIDAAMKYKFTPAILRDKPVAVWAIIPFSYKPKPEMKTVTVDVGSESPPEKYREELIRVENGWQSYQNMIKKYDTAMYFERMKEYEKALKSYQEFVAESKEFPMGPEEMVRYAKMMIEKYSKIRVKDK